MTTHTPGPWYEVGKSRTRSEIAAADTNVTHIAIVPADAPANNRLIAAAPELLAALLALVNTSDGRRYDRDVMNQIRGDAWAAIAKATGGEVETRGCSCGNADYGATGHDGATS